MRAQIAFTVFAAVFLIAGAKQHEKLSYNRVPAHKQKKLAHKMSKEALRNFKIWEFDEEQKSKHGRSITNDKFNTWLACQEFNGKAC